LRRTSNSKFLLLLFSLAYQGAEVFSCFQGLLCLIPTTHSHVVSPVRRTFSVLCLATVFCDCSPLTPFFSLIPICPTGYRFVIRRYWAVNLPSDKYLRTSPFLGLPLPSICALPSMVHVRPLPLWAPLMHGHSSFLQTRYKILCCGPSPSRLTGHRQLFLPGF